MLSFWEKQTFAEYDFAVAGAGIMGCSVAFELREKFPHARIVLIERGILPTGASSKNAGFACFGSPTEIFSDFQLLGKDKTLEIISQRVEGLNILMKRIGKESAGLTAYGGYELLFANPLSTDNINDLNKSLFPIFKSDVFTDVSLDISSFGFKNVRQLLFCALESQIDSGKLMMNYWKLLSEKDIQIISGANVQELNGNSIKVHNNVNGNIMIKSDFIFMCTNAFIHELLPDVPVKPGRGQVIITSEIDNLSFKGSFHFDEGFYYFRNVGKRVLFGGGRNLDFNTEETTSFESNIKILNDLKLKLNNDILPDSTFEIEQEWQGIMGFSETKQPVILDVNSHTKYVMSCNGMGVALSPYIAKQVVADL